MLPDERIKKLVVEHLYWDGRVNAADVRVACHEGRVVLSGTVPASLPRSAAELDAWRVPGVRAVENLLEIRYPHDASPTTDDDIRINIQNKLLWSPDIFASDMDVAVSNGVVSLTGSVDAYWKKIKAEALAYDVLGAVQVENKLAVTPARDVIDQAIAESIVAALDRYAAVDLNAIEVRVEKGVVTLTGTVTDWNAYVTAQNAAAYTLGVVDVETRLTISSTSSAESLSP